MPIPSNPSDRIKLKTMLAEITKCMQRIDDERQSIKEIAEAAQEQFDVKKKTVTKLARTMYKHNYADLRAENEHFEELYENLIEGKKPNPTTEVDDLETE
jgi:hypothetical protein